MPHDIDAPTQNAIKSNKFNWVILLEMRLPTATVYAHTGVGDLDWNSQTWKGVGNMASFSGLVETADGGNDKMSVALSGIPIDTMPDFVEEMTEQDTAGQLWFMYLAILDDDGEVDGEATEIGAGITGASELIDGDNRIVTQSLVTEAALMRNMLHYRFTNEDQQKFFPGDVFFEFMTDLENELRWGSADPVTVEQTPGPTEHLRSFAR